MSQAVTDDLDAREQRRLAALADYRLLDFPLDDEITALLRVAAAVSGAPNATLNLIDATHQRQPVAVGVEGLDTPRAQSMCNVHFLDGDFVWTSDASRDPRFSTNPWVTGELSSVRFYASLPLLTSDGDALGTLCVFDEVPGGLTEEQGQRLQDVGEALLALFARHRQAWVNARLMATAEQQRAVAERALTEAKRASDRLASIIAGAHDAFAGLDPDGLVTEWNEAAEVMFGFPAEVAVGRPITDLIIPLERRAAYQEWLQGLASRGPQARSTPRREIAAVRADGSPLPVEVSVWQVDEPGGIFVFLRDVSERRAHETAQARRQELLNRIVEIQAAIAEVELTPSKVMARICEFAEDLTGADGSGISERVDDELRVRFGHGISETLVGARLDVHASLAGQAALTGRTVSDHDSAVAGHTCPACASASVESMLCVPLRHAGAVVAVLTVVARGAHRFDSIDRSSLELVAAPFGAALANAWQMQRTSARAVTDELTGLANRTLALRELERALGRRARQGGEVAVMFIDLDRFKPVNDSYGHSVGDALLVQVADRLRKVMRTTDTPARFGGDEFVVVCENLADGGSAEALAGRILAALHEPYRLHGAAAAGSEDGQDIEVRLGASIGVAVSRAGIDSSGMREAADAAMYEAKRAGGDRVRVRQLD